MDKSRDQVAVVPSWPDRRHQSTLVPYNNAWHRSLNECELLVVFSGRINNSAMPFGHSSSSKRNILKRSKHYRIGSVKRWSISLVWHKKRSPSNTMKPPVRFGTALIWRLENGIENIQKWIDQPVEMQRSAQTLDQTVSANFECWSKIWIQEKLGESPVPTLWLSSKDNWTERIVMWICQSHSVILFSSVLSSFWTPSPSLLFHQCDDDCEREYAREIEGAPCSFCFSSQLVIDSFFISFH